MPDQGMTPEEKLLRIIESPGEAARHSPRARLNVQAGSLFLKAWFSHQSGELKKTLSLRVFNQAVMTLCGVMTVYLVIDFFMGMPSVTFVQRLERAAKKANIGNISVEGLSPLSVYVREIGRNNIFSLPESGAPSPAAARVTAVSDTLKTIVQSFRVVGIIWADVPQVIIEDTKEGRTYFLNRGNKLKDVRIKEILRDRVVLSYDNQEIELR
jgi:hypothetical protein